MKIIVNKSNKENLSVIFERLGYHLHQVNGAKEYNFIKRLGDSFYPRFHIYAQEKNGILMINLHLDQKRVSHVGQKAHSGEYYDSELLEQEVERVKKYFEKNEKTANN